MQELPPIFATFQNGRHTGVVSVYDTTPVPTYPYNESRSPSSYSMIAPHRFYQQNPTPTFIAADRPPYIPLAPVTLISATPTPRRDHDERILYRGEAWLTGEDIFCLYHPMPIPVIVFGAANRQSSDESAVALPTTADCQLEIMTADRHALRFWERRWTPEYIARDLHDEARPVVGPTFGEARPVCRPSPTVKLPKFVADLVIADAVGKGAQCPITLEPLTVLTATVTPCGHVFDAAALARWVSAPATTPTNTCPYCKNSLTSSYPLP
jgi:hypothetical protein